MIKIGAVIFVMILTISLGGCGTSDNSVSTAQTDISISDLSSEELLETAIVSIKNADAKTFNACVVYPDKKNHNIYFGDDLSNDDGYIKTLFENLSFEILQTKEQTDITVIISCRISNKDLSNLSVAEYSDENNPLVAAIQNADTDIISKEIDINLKKYDNQWKIMIDDNFTNAISGGRW